MTGSEISAAIIFPWVIVGIAIVFFQIENYAEDWVEIIGYAILWPLILIIFLGCCIWFLPKKIYLRTKSILS